jgi:HK97 family phage portal protein
MAFFNPFRREKRQTLEEILIKGGALTNSVSKPQALNIPALSACVELISATIASLPIKLYKETGETTESVPDTRVDLLNDDTKDTLDGFQFKHALVEDYLLHGGGYAYINRTRNEVTSLHYVDNLVVAVTANPDPIYKSAQLQVNGELFREFQFVKLLRKSKDGVTGKGIIKENNVMLSVAYNAMIYEEIMVKTGGNKKGFLKSQGRLSKEAMDELKRGWKDLYANNQDNIMVLNNGLDFQEASQTSVELQLNEHKQANSDQICKLFLVPPRILSGEADEEEYNNWIKVCILPILAAFEIALNKDLLLPSEKEKFYFAFDTTELTKGNMKERYEAYDIGIKSGFMQIDEVRYKENLSPLELNWIKLGLQDVLYFPDSEEIYTPNTNKLAKMGEQPLVDPNQPNGGVANEGLPNNAGLGTKPEESDDPSKGERP